MYTSNNQRLRSARDNDRRSKRFLLQRCTLHKFHVTDALNTRDKITSDRRSKRAWPKCVLCIPYILSLSPNECWLHTSDACVIATWRLGLGTTRGARNNSPRALGGDNPLTKGPEDSGYKIDKWYVIRANERESGRGEGDALFYFACMNNNKMIYKIDSITKT